MHRRLLALASILASASCTEHAPPFYNITDEAPATETTTAASFPATSTPPDPTTTDTPSDAATTSTPSTSTTTEADTSSAPGSSSAPENASPEIHSFTVDPAEIFEPGPVKLSLELSDDVATVELWHGATLLGTVAPAELPFTFDVTSQGTCQGSQTFTAVARDLEGLTDSAPADPGLFCQLPAPGSEVYTSYLEGAIGTAVALRPDGGVIAAGALDERMMLWRLDAAGGPVAGWPKTIEDWTLVFGLGAKDSGANAVAVDPTGAILVAGYYKNGIAFRRYVAKLSENGTLLWEDPGLVDGEEIMGLAVSPDGDVVAAGSLRTTPLDKDALYDAWIWGYPSDYPYGADRWARAYEFAETDPPDPQNKHSERARAVLALPDQFAVLAERDYFGVDNNEYTRALVVRFSPSGEYLGQWTSDGAKYAHDTALAGTTTDNGFVIAGWCRHDAQGATQQTCFRTFDANLAPDENWAEPWPFASSGLGVAHDREGRIVVAAYTSKPGQTDAWIFASHGAGSPLAWQQAFDGGGWDFAASVVCEPWGRCTWVGTTEKNGTLSLVASQRYP